MPDESDDEVAWVTVEWADGVVSFPSIGTSDSDVLDQPGFYALLAAHKDRSGEYYGIRLLYIGLAFRQTLRQRIWQNHAAYAAIEDDLDESDQNLVVMLGTIVESSHDLTKALFEAVEGCLIAANEPPMNGRKVRSYRGPSIRVTNSGGYAPLLEEVEIS